VVVVNDGAPPHETAELRAIVSRYDGQIRYLERENGGPGGGPQHGDARHELAARRVPRRRRLLAPHAPERELALFDQDPSLDLAYCDARLFGDGPWRGARTWSAATTRWAP
jgi:hypothetical protein